MSLYIRNAYHDLPSSDFVVMCQSAPSWRKIRPVNAFTPCPLNLYIQVDILNKLLLNREEEGSFHASLWIEKKQKYATDERWCSKAQQHHSLHHLLFFICFFFEWVLLVQNPLYSSWPWSSRGCYLLCIHLKYELHTKKKGKRKIFSFHFWNCWWNFFFPFSGRLYCTIVFKGLY